MLYIRQQNPFSYDCLVEVLRDCAFTGTLRRVTSNVPFHQELRLFNSNTDALPAVVENTDARITASLVQESNEVLEQLAMPGVKLKPIFSAQNKGRLNNKHIHKELQASNAPIHGSLARVDSSSGNAMLTPQRSYRTSLRATFEGHQALLKRLDKTQSTMEQTSHTKRLAAMMEQGAESVHNFTIQPSSTFRLTWDVCTTVAVLSYCLAIPLRIMTHFECSTTASVGYTVSINSVHNSTACLSQWDWSLIVDYLCDTMFMADFILRARYFAFRRFEGEREVIECDRDAIWTRFCGTFRFYVLFLLMVPIDLVSVYSGFLLCLRLFKMPSLLLLTEMIQDIQQWLDHERGVSVSAEAITVLHLTFYTVLVTSWMSVGWCLLHYEGAQNYNWISAIYWCLTTATTTGYGDVVPDNTDQTVYNVFITIIGPTIFATIIAKVASYVKKYVSCKLLYFFVFIHMLIFIVDFLSLLCLFRVDVSTNNMEHRLSTVSYFLRSVHPAYSHANRTLAATGSAGASGSGNGNGNDANGESSNSRERGLPGSPFDFEQDSAKNTTTDTASCKQDSSSSKIPLLRVLSGLSAGSTAAAVGGAVGVLRGMAVKSAGTVARALNSTGVVKMKYRPAYGDGKQQGIDEAVNDYFTYMDRGGQFIDERSALPKEIAEHISVRNFKPVFSKNY